MMGHVISRKLRESIYICKDVKADAGLCLHVAGPVLSLVTPAGES